MEEISNGNNAKFMLNPGKSMRSFFEKAPVTRNDVREIKMLGFAKKEEKKKHFIFQ